MHGYRMEGTHTKTTRASTVTVSRAPTQRSWLGLTNEIFIHVSITSEPNLDPYSFINGNSLHVVRMDGERRLTPHYKPVALPP